MQESEDIQWASRWDYILSSVPQSKYNMYQWSVLIYNIFIIFLLSFFAGLIICHSLRQGRRQTVRHTNANS